MGNTTNKVIILVEYKYTITKHKETHFGICFIGLGYILCYEG